MARAVMNGERTDPEFWRRMFPALFGEGPQARGPRPSCRPRREPPCGLPRGRQSRRAGPQLVPRRHRRGVDREAARPPSGPVRRERRVLFDGVRRDPPLRRHGRAAGEAGGLRLQMGRPGHQRRRPDQLDDAQSHAADEDIELTVALVVFDARRSAESGSLVRGRGARGRGWSRWRTWTSSGRSPVSEWVLRSPRRLPARGNCGGPGDELQSGSFVRSAFASRIDRRRDGPDGDLPGLDSRRRLAALDAARFGRDWYAERGLFWLVGRAASTSWRRSTPTTRSS